MDKILTMVMRHMDLMDASIRSTNRLKEYCAQGDIDGIATESESRERLINVISHFQKQIEEEISSLQGKATKDLIEILKTWSQDVSTWVFKTDEIDQQSNEFLESLKEDTTKEIATIFKNKQSFSGYNLNNLKK